MASFDRSETIFDADRMEEETFYECIALILNLIGNDKSIDFLNKINVYKSENMNVIPNFVKLFVEFKTCLISEQT